MHVALLGAASILALLGSLSPCGAALAAGRAARHVIRPLPASDYGMQRTCGMPAPGRAACMAVRLVPQTAAARAREHPLGRPVSVPASETNACEGANKAAKGCYGLTPQDIHSAYSLPATPASPQTIAIVDAYNDPSAEADLGVYDKEFGLPECTRANGCFAQVNEYGNASPLPQTEGGWAVEISLDIEIAHATCESCQIVLVEADSSYSEDLDTAEATAAGKLAADEISNSWAGGEPVETGSREEAKQVQEALEAFEHPGTVITASSGDDGYLNWVSAEPFARGEVNYPASSPSVVAVGGTRLSLSAEGAWQGETVWNGAQVGVKGYGAAGSGCSAHFSAPAWQSSLADWASVGCGNYRAAADIAADADPFTGVAVYDSTPEEEDGKAPGWQTFGGTSLSSPLIAATFALAGGAGGAEYPAATLYESETTHPGALHDVRTGANGECSKASSDGASGCSAEEAARSCDEQAICLAGQGYDGPTGLGTPDGVAAFTPPGTPVSRAQLITFTSREPAKAIVGMTYEVSAIASSGLPVALSSLTPKVCPLEGSTASFRSEGACTIRATQGGDEEYEAVEAEQSFNVVPKSSQAIAFTSSAPANAKIGGATYHVTATATSGLTVSFASASESTCSVNGSSVNSANVSSANVSFLAAGQCTIEATQAGNAEYLPAPEVEQSFQVGRASQTIHFTTSAPATARVRGPSYEVWAVATSLLPVSFSTATPQVCSLEGETVSFTGGGTCTIAVTQAGNAEYLPAPEVEQSFQVAKAPQIVTFTSAPPVLAKVGGIGMVSASTSSGLAVSFFSESTSVCTVEGSTVRLLGAGTCTIDATQEGDAAYEAAPRARQSFNVEATQQVLPTPLPSTPLPTLPSPGQESPSTSKPVVSFTLLRSSVERKSGAIRLTMSFNAPGRLTWLLRFERAALATGGAKAKARTVRAVFGSGGIAIAGPRRISVTVRPSPAALRQLERLRREGRGLRVHALLRFRPAEGGSPAPHRRSVTVRLRRA